MRLVLTLKHVQSLQSAARVESVAPVWHSVRRYRFTPNMSGTDRQWTNPIEPFQPKKALILAKFSRYEFEKRRNPAMSEEELIRSVSNRFICFR